MLKEASKSQEVTEDKLIEYTDTMVGISCNLKSEPLHLIAPFTITITISISTRKKS